MQPSEQASGAAPEPATTSQQQTSSGEPSTSGDGAIKVGEERKHSCMRKFDALWFCYSPAYQIQQLYVRGDVDDCSSKWNELMDCLKKKTKYRDEVVQAEAEKRHPLWEIRTHQEAEQCWERTFGHLSREAGTQELGDDIDGAQHSGQPTLV